MSITSKEVRQYVTKLNTHLLERLYLEIFAMLEERDLKQKARETKKKEQVTAKVDTQP